MNNKTGFTVSTKKIIYWEETIHYLIDMKENRPNEYKKMRNSARNHILQHYNWDNVINEIFEVNNNVEKNY